MTVSIFNDVIGPVMRGPSSSHCAAALRLGRLALDLMNGEITKVFIQFDRSGSLPTTHTGQGSDMGLFGGLMGWNADDERLPESRKYLEDSGVEIEFEYGEYGDKHPNTYRLTLTNGHASRTLIGISTGGGMIEVTEIDGYPVSTDGGYFETLVEFRATDRTTMESMVAAIREEAHDSNEQNTIIQVFDVQLHWHETDALIQVRSDREYPQEQLDVLLEKGRPNPGNIATAVRAARLSPVLPVRSNPSIRVPFLSCAEMEEFAANEDRSLWELAVAFESNRGAMAESQVIEQMVQIVRVLKKSLLQGLQGTTYQDRVLGFQSGKFAEKSEAGQLLDAGIVNRIVLYTTALMEIKSSMGVIVAAPTAGACAALPATCLAVGASLGSTDEEIAKAMLAAGAIGVFIAHAWSFAAEVGGCQAEGGSASAMSAAAIVTFLGGSHRQATAAASMSLQNMLGLICDPVANRVEVPCLGKNVMAASNAVCCANMALAGFDAVIPLDETIDAARRVSERMPREHRCTGLGGLATTPTSLKLLEKMECGHSGCGSCG